MIEISNLTKTYGDYAAVNNISFNVQKGEIVGFLGPNGAGKSTTMKVITCFMPPTSGTVTVDGMSVLDHSLDIRQMIGYLPEQNPLYPDMNVIDFLTYIAELRNIPKEQHTSRVGKVIDICALGDMLHKDIGQLSKGYKQRVGLAQAMIHDPEILILDEPTIGLDPNQVVDIRNLIKELGEEKTVILSTHIMREVEATCDRAIIINEGNIVADGPLSELRHDIEGKEIINLELLVEDNGVVELLSGIKSVEEVKEVHPEKATGRNFKLISAPGTDARSDVFRKAVEANWVIIGMSREVRTLEEVFHQLTN